MKYTLGIDISTQSITAVVLDFREKVIVQECSLSYTSHEHFSQYPLEPQTKALPDTVPGLVEQPPLLFLDALDTVLAEIHRIMQTYQARMQDIASIAVSAQQHGHVYLGKSVQQAFSQLSQPSSSPQHTLSDIFRESFSYPHAPIWMTSVSRTEADEIRDYVGDAQTMMALSGSNSPARFTGAIIRYIAKQHWQAYQNTYAIQLISNFISGVLSANAHVPIDWGNGSGMSLMDYQHKQWSPSLVEAVCHNLGNEKEIQPPTHLTQDLLNKIGSLQSPLSIAGTIAPYFVQKYAFHPDCKVTIGSGDNPQSKVVIPSDLLSLGTSFVCMSSATVQNKAMLSLNKMYDGIGRPFLFCCRTNGALLWDKVRAENPALSLQKYEKILYQTPIGAYSMHWQLFEESFPPSPSFDREFDLDFDRDMQSQDTMHMYPAIIDTTLAIMAYYTKDIISHSKQLYITGGATQSLEISKRVAALFNKEVVVVNDSGAAVGAAISALRALNPQQNEQEFYDTMVSPLIQVNATIAPEPHARIPKFIQKVVQKYEKLIEN